METIAEILSGEEKLQPDEFTAAMVAEKIRTNGGAGNYDSVRSKLNRMFEAGGLTRRKVVINGKMQTAYRVK